MSERLSVRELHERFIAALGEGVVSASDLGEKPLELELKHPLPKQIRCYIYNLTNPPGGRTLGEHKVQLIVPGQPRGHRGNFDYSGGKLVFLVGYESDLDVFVLWDTTVYRDFPYSMNVQVKAETVYSASTGIIETQSRRLHAGPIELVIASPAKQLGRALELRRDESLKQLLHGGDRS